jgi:hypothetical protein
VHDYLERFAAAGLSCPLPPETELEAALFPPALRHSRGDNSSPGVSRACRYEPDLNPTYQEMATHYRVGVLPARVRKPRDKAKVEVQIVQRWIVAALRHRSCH